MSDLEKAFAALSAKSRPYTTLMDYADGNQPLQYSTKRLQEAFENIDTRFSQNWCSVVIDSEIERMNFCGWSLKDKKATQKLQSIFDRLEISQDAYDIHRSACITRESYAIISKNDDGEIEFNYNDPRLCHIFYLADNPKKIDFACKWYQDSGIWHLILYYADRYEYYITSKTDMPTNYKAFKADDPDKQLNPYGTVPVFHFRLSRYSKGDLFNIRTLQDAVNKLFSDMMVASEFCALNQRYVITEAETSTLKNAPNEIWTLPPGSSAGQFTASGLDNFLNAIDKIANSIAIISRTPKHYFYSAGNVPSGEALLAMESPLTKKVDQRINSFSSTWRKIGAFLLQLEGTTVEPIDITPVWKPSQSIQPKTEADTAKVWVDATVPLKTALSWAGKTDDEIKQMEMDSAEEKAKNAVLSKQLLDQARVKQEQSNVIDETEQE